MTQSDYETIESQVLSLTAKFDAFEARADRWKRTLVTTLVGAVLSITANLIGLGRVLGQVENNTDSLKSLTQDAKNHGFDRRDALATAALNQEKFDRILAELSALRRDIEQLSDSDMTPEIIKALGQLTTGAICAIGLLGALFVIWKQNETMGDFLQRQTEALERIAETYAPEH